MSQVFNKAAFPVDTHIHRCERVWTVWKVFSNVEDRRSGCTSGLRGQGPPGVAGVGLYIWWPLWALQVTKPNGACCWSQDSRRC